MGNICIITGVYQPEPVVSAKVAHSLAKELKNRGENVTVIAPLPSRPYGSWYKDYDDDDFVVRIKSFIARNPSIFSILLESITSGIASIITLHRMRPCKMVYNAGWFLPSRFIVAIYCKLYRIEFIYVIQDIYPESLRFKQKGLIYSILFRVDKWLLHSAKAVHVISEGMKEYIASTRSVTASKIEVIYNWNNLENVYSIKELKYDMVYLGNIGKLSNLVSHLTCLKNIQVKVLIGGNGEYKDKVLEIVNSESSFTYEEVPNGKEIEFLRQARFGFLPVNSEIGNFSIPSKAIAYLMAGKPIITNLPVENDLVRILLNYGCIIRFNDLTHLMDIRGIDDVEYNKMSVSALRCASEVFGKDHNLQKLANLFK